MRSRSREHRVLLGSVVAVLLGATACSSAEPTAPTDSKTTAPTFNDADVAFVVDAGTHLGNTLLAAQLVAGRTQNPAVQELADKLIKAKGPEADHVAHLVLVWGEQGADLAHDSAEHAQQEHAGGLTDRTINTLSRLSGPAFDQLFLESLVEHLKQGRPIWQTEADTGSDPGATQLAENIRAEENALLHTAQQLLADGPT